MMVKMEYLSYLKSSIRRDMVNCSSFLDCANAQLFFLLNRLCRRVYLFGLYFFCLLSGMPFFFLSALIGYYKLLAIKDNKKYWWGALFIVACTL